jgi:monovalent cation/hydrogen antiporter
MGTNVHVQVVFIFLLTFVVVFALLARRLAIPYPIVLVVAGLLLGFVPGLPKLTLNPEVIFLIVLPPLLYSAAWWTSWREFSYNLVSILLLAVGLVGFTVFAVATLAPRILPGFDWQSGFVLGAAVATTDAIAAAAIARRVGLPRRLTDILEGESLVNDATGLLALQIGVAILLGAGTPTVSSTLVRLAYLAATGIGVGLAVGYIIDRIEYWIEDAPVEIAISILVPYASYFAAEALHGSGVLAVVTSGLFLSRRSVHFFSPAVRIEANAVWNSLTFLLNGFVFVLVGLQLPYVLAGIKDVSMLTLLVQAAVFSVVVIALRMIWVFPGAYIAWFIRRNLLGQDEPRPVIRNIFVVGWAGMRGVIALAAAMALPATLPNGAPFEQRNLIIFYTFSVIFVTLVVQGLSLPVLIRVLGVGGSQQLACEEEEARRIVLDAAMEHLEKHRREQRLPFTDVYDDLLQHYTARRALITGEEGGDEHGSQADHSLAHSDLARELLRIEREAAIRLRDEKRISDDVLRQLQQEADLSELRLHAESNARA